MGLIGAAWPNSTINGDVTDCLEMTLSGRERTVSKASAQRIAAEHDYEADDLGDAKIVSANLREGTAKIVGRDEAWEHIAACAAAALGVQDEEASPEDYPNGINYVEMTATFDGQPFVVVAAKGGRTPREIAKRAEARAEAAEQVADAYRRLLDEVSQVLPAAEAAQVADRAEAIREGLPQP